MRRRRLPPAGHRRRARTARPSLLVQTDRRDLPAAAAARHHLPRRARQRPVQGDDRDAVVPRAAGGARPPAWTTPSSWTARAGSSRARRPTCSSCAPAASSRRRPRATSCRACCAPRSSSWRPAAGIPVVEAWARVADLRPDDGVLLTSSVRGVVPVERVDGVRAAGPRAGADHGCARSSPTPRRRASRRSARPTSDALAAASRAPDAGGRSRSGLPGLRVRRARGMTRTMQRFIAIIVAAAVLVGLARPRLVESPSPERRERDLRRQPATSRAGTDGGGRGAAATAPRRRPAPPPRRPSASRSCPQPSTSPSTSRRRPATPRACSWSRRPARIRIVQNGALLATPFLDISRHGLDRRRAGPALDGLRPALRDQRALLRRLHQRERRHARGALPRLELRTRTWPTAVERAGPARRRTSPTPTTTAASCSSAPTAASTSAWATAAATATRSTTRRTRAAVLGKILRIDVERLAGQACDLRQGPAQPVALLVRPQDRRALDRRRRPEHAGRRSTT